MQRGVDEGGRRVFGFAPHQTHWYARSEELINLDNDITDEDAPFIPNLETAIDIVQDMEPVHGDYIGIAGLGVVGILAAIVLHKAHSDRLILIDVKEDQRSLAERFGAQFINPARENLADRIPFAKAPEAYPCSIPIPKTASRLCWTARITKRRSGTMFQVGITGSLVITHVLKRCSEKKAGPTLDERGFAADIARMEAVRDHLVKRMNKVYLNDLAFFKNLQPSLENFSVFFLDELLKEFSKDGGIPAHLIQSRIQVWESRTAWASYERPLGER